MTARRSGATVVSGRTIRTPEKGDKLLAKLAQGYSVTTACQAEGIGRTAYYAWINDDPDFKAQADAAIEAGTDKLEDVARQRAMKQSDTLLIFLLKGRRPEKFKDRVENRHTDGDGGPLTLVINRPPAAE
jgi:hypothetical protein